MRRGKNKKTGISTILLIIIWLPFMAVAVHGMKRSDPSMWRFFVCKAKIPFRACAGRFRFFLSLVRKQGRVGVQGIFDVRGGDGKKKIKSQDLFSEVALPSDYSVFSAKGVVGKEEYLIISGRKETNDGALVCYRFDPVEEIFKKQWVVEKKWLDFVGVTYWGSGSRIFVLGIDGRVISIPWRPGKMPGKEELILPPNVLPRMVSFSMSRAFLRIFCFGGRAAFQPEKNGPIHEETVPFVSVQCVGGSTDGTNSRAKTAFFQYLGKRKIVLFEDAGVNWKDPLEGIKPVFDGSTLDLLNAKRGIPPDLRILDFSFRNPRIFQFFPGKGHVPKEERGGFFHAGRTYLQAYVRGDLIYDGLYFVPLMKVSGRTPPGLLREAGKKFSKFFKTLEINGGLLPPEVPLSVKDLEGGEKALLLFSIQKNPGRPEMITAWNKDKILVPQAACFLGRHSFDGKTFRAYGFNDSVHFVHLWFAPKDPGLAGLSVWGQWILFLKNGKVQVFPPVGGVIRKKSLGHSSGSLYYFPPTGKNFERKWVSKGTRWLQGLPGLEICPGVKGLGKILDKYKVTRWDQEKGGG